MRPVSVGLLSLAAFFCSATALRAGTAPLKFWNVTAASITELYLSPVGSGHWSGNLCLTDPDHVVDADERLRMPGITGGTYNVRIVDKSGRHCILHAIAVSANGPYAFSLSESQMKECAAN